MILATGIFYPDVGGPAIHVRKIAEALVQHGYKPVVIAYGDYDGPEQFPFKVVRISNKLKPLLRRLKFLLTVFKESFGAEKLYAFNLSTTGLPVFLVGKLFRKKILIRVPGDPIWERIVEGGKRLVSFANYYEQGLHMVDRPWLGKAIRFTLPRFDKIIFYTPFLSEIYQKHYNAPAEKISIVLNPVHRRNTENHTIDPENTEPTVLFAGRFVAYKNLELVIRAFNQVRQKLGRGKLVMIGDGPDKEKLTQVIKSLPSAEHIEILPKVSQDKLFEHVSSSWVGIGPALTEFNPNFILECLSFGKPVLLSRENGLSVKLPEEFLFDPGDENELTEKMSKLFDPSSYQNAVSLINNLKLNQSWDDVIDSHLRLLGTLD